MKIPDFLRKFIACKMPVIRTAIFAGVAWLVSWVCTNFAFDVSEDFREELSTYIAGALWIIVLAWMTKYLHTGVKDMQTIIPNPAVKSDGDPGPVTKAGLKQIVNEAAGEVVAPITRDESAAMKEAVAEVVAWNRAGGS